MLKDQKHMHIFCMFYYTDLKSYAIFNLHWWTLILTSEFDTLYLEIIAFYKT